MTFSWGKVLMAIVVIVLVGLGVYTVYSTIVTQSSLKLPIYYILIAIGLYSLMQFIAGKIVGLDGIVIYGGALTLSILGLIYAPKLFGGLFSLGLFSAGAVGVNLDVKLAITGVDAITTFIQTYSVWLFILGLALIFKGKEIAVWLKRTF